MINLIGLKYPIIGAPGNDVIGYRVVKKQYEIENAASIAISLTDETDSLILISYGKSAELCSPEKQEELSKLPEIPFK